MKIIHLTDTHLVIPGQRLFGLDPQARLASAVADINANHADAAKVVVTGDLTHWGEPQAYDAFHQTMAKLAIPYIPLLGNHDRRANCLAALNAAPRDRNGFVQGSSDQAIGRFLYLDTLNETSHAGQLCEKRLAWLAGALAAPPADHPLYLFMHHPPFAVGIHDMDRISLADSEAFLETIRPALPRIRHLFFGHVHRPISGSWNGIPFSSLRGTSHQVWFDLRPNCDHLASYEPPAYGVILINQNSIVVHTHDFLFDGPRFPFSKPGRDDRAYQLGPIEAVQ